MGLVELEACSAVLTVLNLICLVIVVVGLPMVPTASPPDATDPAVYVGAIFGCILAIAYAPFALVMLLARNPHLIWKFEVVALCIFLLLLLVVIVAIFVFFISGDTGASSSSSSSGGSSAPGLILVGMLLLWALCAGGLSARRRYLELKRMRMGLLSRPW